jgi:hypothetical protein
MFAPGEAEAEANIGIIGDADGLGETRKKELIKSGLALGLRKPDDVFIVESQYVPLYTCMRRLLITWTGSSRIA